MIAQRTNQTQYFHIFCSHHNLYNDFFSAIFKLLFEVYIKHPFYQLGT